MDNVETTIKWGHPKIFTIFLSYWPLFARMADKKFLIRIPIESSRAFRREAGP